MVREQGVRRIKMWKKIKPFWNGDNHPTVVAGLQLGTLIREATDLIDNLEKERDELRQQLLDLAVDYERELSSKRALYNYLNEVREHGDRWE